MRDKVFILGAGGMAKVVYQLYKACNKESNIQGFLIDVEIAQNKEIYGKSIENFKDVNNFKDTEFINGIGNPLRKNFIDKIEKHGYKFSDKIIHPTSTIIGSIQSGDDLVVCANSVLSNNAKIGKHVLVGSNSYIGHDASVGDYVTVSPGVNIGGNSSIGEGSFIGIGSTVIQKIKIGNNVLIGAGSTVVSGIPDNSLAYGNPAKPIKKITDDIWKSIFE